MNFSIITVSYNSASTIMQTINSVDGQTLKDWEHIIVDGLSTDETPKLISSSLHRRRKFLSEEDQGIYDAMNKGIALASGDIVGILNSDDCFANNGVLQEIQNIFTKTNCDIVYSGIEYIDQQGRSVTQWIPKKFIKGSYQSGFHTPHPGFFAKRAVYERLGNFDKELNIAADFDLMRRFMESEYFKSELLPVPTVEMRMDGTSSKIKNIIRGQKDIRRSFAKDGNSPNLAWYFFKRYCSKIERKIKTIFQGMI